MATILDSKITVTQERRPCMVCMGDGTYKKALWHMFTTKAIYEVRDAILQGQTGGQLGFSYPVAVVEYEDGTLRQTEVNAIRFLDSKQEFEQYAWEDMA